MSIIDAYESLYNTHILLLQIIAWLGIVLASVSVICWDSYRVIKQQRRYIATISSALQQSQTTVNGEAINWSRLRRVK